MKRLLPYLLPVLLLNLVSALSFWESGRQGLLASQLEQSVGVLNTENEHATKQAQNALQAIQDAVAKNRNRSADIARQRRAEALHARVAALADSLHAQAALLRRRTGNAAAPANLRVPGSQPFREVYKIPLARYQALRRQLATCADTLRHYDPAPASGAAPTLPAPVQATTVVEALADLAQAESLVLTHESRALHHLVQALASQQWLTRPIALVAADQSTVAPGDTYRAHLLITSYLFSQPRMSMARDGHPVPIDANGIGQVRFRAPLRPGPASWTGTIRVGTTGRDTTFVVRVPYRVARR